QRVAIAAKMPTLLEIWYNLEALASLGNFADLNPEYTFPEFANDETPTFEAKALGHPLLSPAYRVCNDFLYRPPTQIVIITGSNMSGKSTFLRTIGVNLALAYAGGPVNADRLRVSLFRLFTCIRVNDSVTDGYSYFYAEVRRLKELLNLLEAEQSQPVFFLIDEIFKGTNSHERLIGSQSYIKALIGKNGIGVVSTHDLELA